MVVEVLKGAEGAFGRREIGDAKRAQLIKIIGRNRSAFVQPGEDDRLVRPQFVNGAQDGRQLDADGHGIGLDDARDDAAEPVVGEQRRQRPAIEVGIDEALRRQVQRV